MRNIPDYITNPETIARLNQISLACQHLRERKKILVRMIQSNHHSRQDFAEYREVSSTLHSLEKAWEALAPSRLETALQRVAK